MRPLVTEDGQGRSAVARHDAQDKIRQSEDFKKESSLNDRLILTKNRFKKFKRDWDNMSDSEASELFDEMHQEQNGDHDQGQVAAVAVADVPRPRSHLRELPV